MRLDTLWKRIKPPYAERHVRWCEREGNESRSENFRFPTYSIKRSQPLSQSRKVHQPKISPNSSTQESAQDWRIIIAMSGVQSSDKGGIDELII